MQQTAESHSLLPKTRDRSASRTPPHFNYTGIINLTFKTEDQWNLLLANMGRFRRVMSLKGGAEKENAETVDYCNLKEELHHRPDETNYS